MKNAYWAWAVKNSVCVICWTALAIVFNKWWIAFFAALFLSDLKTKTNSYRICDGCGKHSPYAETHNEALEKAKEAGWVSEMVNGKMVDYCPECSKNHWR